ncbi:Uncharacterized protein OS=Planctomyces brasiliensis (strain ATCC 49424 / DSM 5305 / JCM 21570 / NBRC 103401 / IFAM 1448) GN=Plabr_1214 PE=4 SV=1 [Gemmata massiliana]|uniref:Uncharacterized protein n=1 Tax=Gemmata massiliana TaxID=1210884 RepID=A0A6P2D3Z7_9BACT|nr:hypothetical protein [Gemmata massiliana]VTR94172.1 Uncharacterized protein OS=Planctomyces brasiliensis (strain ATCC 49424 / DSM 5305 / JCM 21570 / NBRC 103401 / IFAM 1448) GN=Plabr_1214 PE=4 SV=1 [Gemmata massiliana]
MRTPTTFSLAATMLFVFAAPCRSEDVIFEDAFKDGPSKKWEPVGLDKKDYRVKDGGLEMRVQNGPAKKGMPVLKVILPFKTTDTVIVSVKVTPLDEFTADGEFAGVDLWTDGSPEFAAKKERVKGKLVFAPGKYVFKGKKGEEGDVEKYEVKYTEVTKDAGDLRITVDRGTAFFSVGPSPKGEYTGFFHSALQRDVKECGFCLTAAGAPEKANHWVRFTDFKVVKP